MKRIKKENGSVTVVVFSTVTFLLIIMAAIFTTMIYKRKSQAIELHDLKEVYESSMEEAYIERTSGFLTGNGSEEQPFGLYTIEDLVKLSNQTNNGNNFNGKFIKLTKTLDFLDDSCYENAYRTDYGDLNGNGQVEELKTELIEGNGFPCISQDEANAFSGTFLGNNEEIRNLYIHREDGEARIGFFANLGNSKIEGLGLTGEITSKTKNSLGGLTGAVVSGTTCEIDNCHNKVNVSSEASSNSVGGFVANVFGTLKISNSNNDGKISGSNNAGGLIGYMNGTVNIQNCSNKGEVTNTLGDHAGGLIGRDNATTDRITITNSNNSAPVQGNVRIGGIMGYSYGNTEITNTYNTGNITNLAENVTKTSYMGGISGRLHRTTLRNSYNTGIIDSKVKNCNAQIYNGGIVAVVNSGVISNCYNSGKISNTTRAGGLVGHATGTDDVEKRLIVANSYNAGDMDLSKMDSTIVTVSNATGRASGIVMYPTGIRLDIINCYNTGDLSTVSFCGGITGSSSSSTINIINSYNTGDLTSISNAYGICGINNSGSTVKVENVYNGGNLTGSGKYGIAQAGNMSANTLQVVNAYYRDNASIGAQSLNPDPCVQMSQPNMQLPAFVETLNTNKNNINLSTYNLADYTLSSWKSVTNGYPEFE